MRILILHMRYHPDLTGTAPLVTDLAAKLAAMGDEVTVITSMPHYGLKQIASKYRGKAIHREKINGVDVWRTFVYVPPNHKGFYRSINYLSYTFMSIASGILAEGVDVILCVNPPITVGFSGWLLSLSQSAPMVLNIQDVWPDCIAIIGQLRSRWLYRLFKYLEKFLYERADRVTVLSEGMKRNLEDKKVRSSKIAVIPNWADLDAVKPMEKNNGFRSKHGLKGNFIAMFAGNIGFISVLDTVLDAASIVKDRIDIQFLIVGEGNAKAALVEKAAELAMRNVRFLPTQAPAILPEMLAAADLSLVTLDRRLGQLNVPSKTYNIMASGRPVLAAVPADSEIARLVTEADCGITVPPEDPPALADAIVKMQDDPNELERLGKNGREYVEKHYAKDKIIRQYRDLLHEFGIPKIA
jgi:colanic acid biosynthesis glycosyl transferase WcaI